MFQAQRAGRLAEEAGLKNVRFQVMDALNMEQGAEIGVQSSAKTHMDSWDQRVFNGFSL